MHPFWQSIIGAISPSDHGVHPLTREHALADRFLRWFEQKIEHACPREWAVKTSFQIECQKCPKLGYIGHPTHIRIRRSSTIDECLNPFLTVTLDVLEKGREIAFLNGLTGKTERFSIDDEDGFREALRKVLPLDDAAIANFSWQDPPQQQLAAAS